MTNTIGIEKIGQIAIAVSELEPASDFYQNTLGLQLLFDVKPNLAFFSCGDIRVMLTTLQGDKKDHRSSVIYYQVDNIQVARDSLLAKGVRFEQEPQFVAKMPDHDLWMGFIRDPDHNLIGIMAEVPHQSGAIAN